MSFPIRVGAVLPTGFRIEYPESNTRSQYDQLLATAFETEALGFDSCWIYDHFQPWPITDSPSPVFESWTTLASIAQATSRIRIGTLVSCAGYRNPALLAKMASTIDVISNGRLDLGLGSGWFQQEAESYGFDFPAPRERIKGLRESIEIIKKMWSEPTSTFDGEFHSVKNAMCFPKPIQHPHPPIYVGGGGKMTLKVAASLADGVNLDSDTLDGTKEKLKVLREHCSKLGRPFESIEKTIHRFIFIAEDGNLARKRVKEIYDQYVKEKKLPAAMTLDDFVNTRICGTPSECTEQLSKYPSLGITGFVFWIDRAVFMEPLKLFANKVIPFLRSSS
ncbi:MAG: LLM class flavin-dependent oxidoreductase [Nitrososphaerales archaeon]